MSDIYNFDRSQPADRFVVGETAFCLDRLWRNNIPVISGLVITSDLYRQLSQNIPDLSLPVNVDNYQTLRSIAKQNRLATISSEINEDLVREIYLAATTFNSPFLILRPSLVIPKDAKSPHFYESPICYCQREDIERKIKQIYADIFSAKSLFYWQRQGISIAKIATAILLQPLYNVIASGTAIVRQETIEIHTTFGLEQSITTGEVIPDRYLIDKKTREIKIQELGKKNIAYYHPSHLKSVGDYLEQTNLSEKQQENFSLTPTQLNSLLATIDKIDKLNISEDLAYSFAWVLVAKESKEEAQFYLTEYSYDSDNILSISSDAESMQSSVRTEDIEDIEIELKGIAASSGKVRARAYIIADLTQIPQDIPAHRILVVSSLSTPSLSLLKQAAGIIAETGGMTSHIAIVARELGIPAVLSVINATQSIAQGMMLALDGDTGEIVPLSATQADNASEIVPTQLDTIKLTIPSQPTATQLYINLSQPQSLTHPAIDWVDGLGILRSELMLLDLFANKSIREWLGDSEKILFVEHLSELICRFAKAFIPRPVFYRSLDWCFPGMGVNPFLGRRGTYNYLVDPSLFDLELEALVSAISRGYRNINLILPFVRSIEEFNFCRRRIEQIGLSDRSDFQLWIMAEVPSVIWQLEEYVKAGAKGIAIGSNDLMQLILGVDRDNSDISKHFNILHPSMLKALEQLIKTARQLEIPVTFIASTAGGDYLQLIDRLVAWGITGISVELEGIEKIHRSIFRAEQKIILNKLR